MDQPYGLDKIIYERCSYLSSAEYQVTELIAYNNDFLKTRIISWVKLTWHYKTDIRGFQNFLTFRNGLDFNPICFSPTRKVGQLIA